MKPTDDIVAEKIEIIKKAALTDKIILAIDPDAKESGLCVLNKTTKKLICLFRLNFIKLLKFIKSLENCKLTIVIEAGWLTERNWHLPPKCGANKASSIGIDIGRNHETGRKICEIVYEFTKFKNIILQPPLKKIWSKGKISQKEIECFITDFPTRSNQDERDAALLAWNQSNLPIRINTKQWHI